MIGITSYGGYIPRLRLDRMSIVQSMGWFAPGSRWSPRALFRRPRSGAFGSRFRLTMTY